MKNEFSIALLALLLSGCSVVQHWNGTDGPGSVEAKFGDLHGKQTLSLKNHGTTHLIKYHILIDQGELKVRLLSPSSGTLLAKQLGEGDYRDSIWVKNPDDKAFSIILTGLHSSGSFEFVCN